MENHETVDIPDEFPGVDLEPDHYTVVPAVDEEVVDDNTTAAVASTNDGITHTSTVDPTGPSHRIP